MALSPGAVAREMVPPARPHNPPVPPKMILCSYEDRAGSIAGVELFLLSMAEAVPGVPIDVTCPNLRDRLAAWAETVGLSGVTLRGSKDWPGSGWNVKPGKLLELLDEGHDEVIWIDTDIVAHRDFRPAIAGLSPETLVVGQEFRVEHPEGTRIRTTGWGLSYARYLPYTVNSGFVRATQAHRPLLRRWQELMSRPDYVAAQARPIGDRPPAMLGDQDVLWSLLGSSEFASIPVHYLRCGDEIIQNSGANGYRVIERLRHLVRGLPPLIHALGREKPWNYREVPDLRSHRRDYLELALLELSPYVAVASRFSRRLSEPAPWLGARTALARTMRLLALNNPSLQGLPLALVAEVMMRIGRKAG